MGDAVEVLSLNQIGNVLELPDENGDLTVQVGIMKVNVNISTLRRAEIEEKRTQASTKAIIKSKSSNIKMK